jgi:hypothetical protein
MHWTYDVSQFMTIVSNFSRSEHIFRKLCWNCGRKHLQFVVWNVCYFCYILMEIERCGQFLVQLPSIKFSSQSAFRFSNCYPQTDIHDEAKRHFIFTTFFFNPLNAELNLICHLLALSGAHPILHVSRIRVNERFEWSTSTIVVRVTLTNRLVLHLPKFVPTLLPHAVIWH